MATAVAERARSASGSPLLASGDRLTQPEFHRRYRLLPDDVKAELIGGIVYMSSPLGWSHANYHTDLNALLWLYASNTPGVAVGDNATTILGEESEPQPDLMLRILFEHGGRSHVNSQGYIEGPPELLAEIAVSSRSIDLHLKKDDYQRAGVAEYIVFCAEERQLFWFNLKSRRSIPRDARGIFRSRVFPGLWIDGPALIAHKTTRLIEVVQHGIATREHSSFVKRLEATKRRGDHHSR
jgi:Uma2 family endonuclease